jgi:hypothetical protein
MRHFVKILISYIAMLSIFLLWFGLVSFLAVIGIKALFCGAYVVFLVCVFATIILCALMATLLFESINGSLSDYIGRMLE